MRPAEFERKADTIETFVGRAETYDDLIQQHRDGEVATERVERYITEGLTEGSQGLVDAWVDAYEAAEDLREADFDETTPEDAYDDLLPSTEQPDRPRQPPRPGRSGRNGSIDRASAADRLWNTFYEGVQLISEHESYALREFDDSPASYRRKVDDDYATDVEL